MTNTERQRSLDKKKLLESIENDCDMSGKMNYCFHCEYQTCAVNGGCEMSQEDKEKLNPCATAYNRMRR